MKRIILICIAVLWGSFFTWADEISFADINFQSDETANIGINLTNQNTQYVSFQMDVYLPDGMALNRSKCTLSSRFDQELVIGKQDDGAYRFTSTSFSLTPISGTSGRLLNLSVTISDDFSSGTVQIRNIRFVTSNSERVILNDISLPISFTVAKFKVDDKSRIYGEDNPTFTYTVTEGELNGSPALSTTATGTSPVGTYDIVASRGTIVGRFEATNGKLTITKAPLTVTANNCTMKQGDALPSFSASYTGFKNNETSAVLSTLPTFRCAATSASAPGTYDIIVSGGSASNYELSYVKGTLTITEADAVTVTAKSYTRVYGDANPIFEYISEGAALNGTPSVTCPATEKSPVGTYPIVISKGRVTNYNDTYVNGKLTITKAPLTVTANNCTMKQGDALPAFSASYTGFKNNETSAVLSTLPTFRCAATSASAPGTYDIIVSGGSASNYELQYVKGTLTITEADPVIVTAKSYTRVYGEANPAFGYDVKGAALDGEPEISCEATATSPVGEYPIVIKKGSVNNYNDTYVNGVLTITKAPLTVTAKSYTINRGDALPDFEATYAGFKNGETAAVLTKQPAFSCAASSNSEEGTYDIIVSGAEARNYAISYTNGTLTIIGADTDIAALDNVVYMEKTEVHAGNTTTLSFKMKNTAAIRGFQFDLYLSEGITAVKNAKGRIQASLSRERLPEDDEHTLTIQEQADGSIRFLCGSQYDEIFTGNDGEIATLQINIAEGLADGDYPIILKDMRLSETDITKYYDTELVKSTLTISSYITGDIDGDGTVNVTDYIGIANHILGIPQAVFIEKAGDVDGDNNINVSDYIGVANIILTGSPYGNNNVRPAYLKAKSTDISTTENVIYAEPLTAEAGTQATMPFRMKNTAAIRGFQFDLYLPEGVTVVKNNKGRIQASLSSGRLPEDDEHTLTVQEQADGAIRFLCGSQYDETFTGNEGEIATLQVNIADGLAGGDYPVVLRNMRLSETDISKYYDSDNVETTLKVAGGEEPKKCATPTIAYAGGKLKFGCETEGVQFASTITDNDIKSYDTEEVSLCVTYTISVYATKSGYDNSDVATATLCWIEQQPDMEGITDDEDAVAEVKAIPVLIQTEGSTITVQGASEGTGIAVYSVGGAEVGSVVARKGIACINTNLQPGSVAVVKIGEKAVKVLIK